MAIKPRNDEQIDSFTDYILNNYVENDVAQFSTPTPPMFGVIFHQPLIGLLI